MIQLDYVFLGWKHQLVIVWAVLSDDEHSWAASMAIFAEEMSNWSGVVRTNLLCLHLGVSKK